MKKVLFSLLLIMSFSITYCQVTPQQIDIYKGVATGTNSYSVTIGGTNNPTTPYLGQTIKVKHSNGNSGASTLKVSTSSASYSAKNITQNGSALIGGEISANTWIIYVYDTASSGQWQIQHGSSNGWGLTGNSGTTMSNFLGTTDNKTMYVRTNNTPHFNFDSLGRVLIYGSTVLTDPSTTGLLLGGNSSNGYIQALSPGRGDLILNGVGNLVGVGLSTPKATFHVKYQGLAQDSGYIFRFDNSSSSNIFNLSSVGVLTLNGTVKINGGSPGTGKVLTGTDGLGNANWQTLSSGVTSVNAGTDITITGTSTPTVSVIPNPTFAISTTTPLLIGNTTSGGTLTLQSTSNATKGKILFGASAYDEVNNRLGLGTVSPAQQLQITGCFRLPVATSSTVGVVYFGTQRGMFALTGTGTSIFVGAGAGNFTGTGGDNAVFGKVAGSSLALGSNNCFFGSSCGGSTDGSFNLCAGYGSALSNTIGNSNVALGFLSLNSNVTGSENIAIGANAALYETGSNSFYVNTTDLLNSSAEKAGSLLYGTTGGVSSSQTLRINASVGVNSSVAAASGMIVKGFGASAADYAWQVGNSTTAASFFVARNDKRIGLGTVNPSTDFQVQGSSGLGGQIYINTSSGFPGICMGNNTSMASASHQAMFGMAIAANDYAFGTALGDGVTNSKAGKLAFVLGASTGTGGIMQANINTTGMIIQNTDGTTATAKLQTIGNGSTAATYNLKLSNSSGDSLLYIKDDGTVTGRVLTSGTYSPTLTNTTNIATSSLVTLTLYTRVANIVTAQYSINVKPSVTATNCNLTVTLPLPVVSPFTSVMGQGTYVDVSNNVIGATVFAADATHCVIAFLPANTASEHVLNFSVTYRTN